VFDLTIRELFREFVAARERAQDEHDRLITQAWWMANLSRKKPPALSTLIKQRHTEVAQTVSQARTVVEILSAQYGIPLRKTRIRRAAAKG
jgi:hypothetical protein